MDVSAHRRAAPGELVAYDLPPGPHWTDILAGHVERGVSFCPVDVRLTPREKRRLLDRVRPTILVTQDDEIVFGGGLRADPERAWACVATSGTSGAPKVAMLPRSALGSAVARSLDALGIDPGDPWVSCLTPAHVGGLLVLLRGAMAGSPVTVLDRFGSDALVRAAPPGAHVSLVPTMLARLLVADVDLSRFGVLLLGGAALEPELRAAAQARGGRVVATYGATETCGGVVYDGVPFEGTDVRVAAGGRIELRGPTLMDGYRDDPSATAAAFTVDGWLRTGDLGAFEDGRLAVFGREGDAIRTGAETVWPEEVERVLLRHPRVRDVAVAGTPDPEWGEHVTAWVVARDRSAPPTLDELREHSRDALARSKAPKELRLVDAIPRTASGKIRRADLVRDG